MQRRGRGVVAAIKTTPSVPHLSHLPPIDRSEQESVDQGGRTPWIRSCRALPCRRCQGAGAGPGTGGWCAGSAAESSPSSSSSPACSWARSLAGSSAWPPRAASSAARGSAPSPEGSSPSRSSTPPSGSGSPAGPGSGASCMWYLAEFKSGAERKEATEGTMNAYKAAQHSS